MVKPCISLFPEWTGVYGFCTAFFIASPTRAYRSPARHTRVVTIHGLHVAV